MNASLAGINHVLRKAVIHNIIGLTAYIGNSQL